MRSRRSAPDISRGESRRYDVAVDPGKELKLDLDWEIETALRVPDDSVALALSYEPDQRRMEEIARRLRERARSANAPDGERVILIGIEQACGHTIVSGMHYPDLPRVLIGHVVMGRGQRPSPASRAREVRPAGRGVIKVQRRRRRDQARARRRAAVELHDGSFSLVLPLLLAGAVALAGGMTWHYIAAAHPADPVAELSLSNPRVQSLVVAGTGGYLLGAGVAAWARRRHGMRALPAITMAACIGTVLAGSVLFATDQYPSGKTLYYQDSGTPGLIVGAVGVSCLGAAYLLSRADPPPSVPVVSLSPGHVSLGWGRARVRTYQPTARPGPRRCNRGPVKLRDVAAGGWNFRVFSHTSRIERA